MTRTTSSARATAAQRSYYNDLAAERGLPRISRWGAGVTRQMASERIDALLAKPRRAAAASPSSRPASRPAGFEARRSGPCQRCAAGVQEGERIAKSGRGYAHTDCAAAAQARAAAEAAETARLNATLAAAKAKAERQHAAARAQVEAMPSSRIEAEIESYRRQPPTLDYLVEYGRAMARLSLLREVLAEREANLALALS
jgi:hypothetical protein